MSEYTPTTEQVRAQYADGEWEGTTQDYAEFDRWLAAHDAELRAESESDPAKDERLVRYMAMATPLGYQSALTVVQQMTLMIQAETEAQRAGVVAEEPEGFYVIPNRDAPDQDSLWDGTIHPTREAAQASLDDAVIEWGQDAANHHVVAMVPVEQGGDDA